MDITLKPTSFSGRSQMIEAELRYKTENSKSEIQLANMEKDDVKGKGRHAYLPLKQQVFYCSSFFRNTI